jgi:16S rRNA (guanine1207-N2)-methyltransferase
MNQSQDYYSSRLLTENIGGASIRYYSKPGIPEWDEISPALHLLADHTSPRPSDIICCINTGSGALPTMVAQKIPLGSCLVSTYDSLALTCSQLTLKENNTHNAILLSEIDLPHHYKDQIDLILFHIYKGRSLNRRMLLQAWYGLKPGGRLLIAGANDQGIQSVLKDASQLFHNVTLLAYKKGNRVAKYLKSDYHQQALPEWATEPGITPGTWTTLHIDLPRKSFDLVTLPGVFSYSGLDEGTRLLTSSLGELAGKKVLDVGCGYGIVGLYAASLGAQAVDMLDNHLLAVASAQENITRNRVTDCQVMSSDLLSEVTGKSYDCILSNPPFHSGIRVNYQIANALIASAFSALHTGGYLQLVANRFIRYDRLMVELFGNVSVLAQTPAYHVLVSKKQQV